MMDFDEEDVVLIYCNDCKQLFRVIAGDETICPKCAGTNVEDEL